MWAHLLPGMQRCAVDEGVEGLTIESPPVRMLLALAAVTAVAVAFVVAPGPALALVVALTILLAFWCPEAAFVVALLVLGFEGSIKALLTENPLTTSVSPEAFGAAFIDLALFTAMVAVVIRRRHDLRRATEIELDRWEKLVLLAGAAWLMLSVVQLALADDLKQGIEGLRLTQSYVLVAAVAALAFPAGRSRRLTGLLVVMAFIAGYAALRVAVGPSDAERAFALSKETVTLYGSVFRAVGSFSSAIGMVSVLVPVFVFTLTLGLLSSVHRVLCVGIAAAAMVGIIGSYARVALVAVAFGMVVALGFAAYIKRRQGSPSAGTAGPSRLRLLGLVAGILALVIGGTVLAAQSSPRLQDRLGGLLQPWEDPSVEMRLETWEDHFQLALDEPLGGGPGTIGSAEDDPAAKTTDNSYLKILIDQGFLGLGLFLVGVLGILALLCRRTARIQASESRIVSVASLSAFAAFLLMMIAGEFIEQPGKVFAWLMIGLAASQVLDESLRADPPSQSGRAAAETAVVAPR